MLHISRIIMGALGSVGLVFFIAALFVGHIHIGKVLGLLIFLWMVLYAAGFIQPALFGIGFLACVLFMGVPLAKMIRAVGSDYTKNAPCIVAGCQVKAGGVPSRELSERIGAAYDYLCENEEAVAVLSGGKGADEDISEARCMYDQLTGKGIDKGRLILEDQSTSTRENIRLSVDLLKERGLGDEVVLISGEYHVARLMYYASQLSVRTGAYPSSTPIILRVPDTVRESVIFWYEWTLGRCL